MRNDYSIFDNKTILLTGGTGTIGQIFVEFLLKSGVSFKEIRIFSRDEKKQFDMKNEISDTRIKFYIGDVRDYYSLINAIKDVNFILHAAALKQVGAMEEFPIEAVKTNILGTNNVINIAKNCGVEKIVVISSDKAVYPVNAMGLSKALMEKVSLSGGKNGNGEMDIICIRLGNVLGSRGSVLPVFYKQLKNNKLITVRGEKMSRFIMTHEEVMELIAYAFAKGNNGQLIVKKMDCCYINDLAKAAVELNDKDEKMITYSDKTVGEKENERLLSDEELDFTVDNDGYYIVSDELGFNKIDIKEIDSSTKIPIRYEELKNKVFMAEQFFLKS